MAATYLDSSAVVKLAVRNRVLDDAAAPRPASVRSLDAVHLATARRLGQDAGVVVTYDERTAEAARDLGYRVESPAG